jgi:integration host factor subunit beta
VVAGKYTKADIVDSLCEKTGISRKQVQAVVDLFIDEIKKALTQNLSIELRGFGTFKVKLRKGRSKARNPKTGEEVAVISHGIAVFRPGLELREAVWEQGQPETGDTRTLPDDHESDC